MISSIAFFIAVICSMLSQTPDFLKSGVDQYLKLTWLLPMFVLFFENHKAFFSKKIINIIVFVVIFSIYCFVLDSFTSNSYVGADLYNIAVSSMVAIVSYAYWNKHGDVSNLNLLAIILLITSIYLSITIYTQFLSLVSISERIYAFQAKNSMGQILLNAMIIIITCFNTKNNSVRSLIYLPMILIVIILFMLKSRATLLGLFFVIAYYIFKYNNSKIRIAAFIITLCIIVYVFTNQRAYEIIVENILFASRDASNINDLSSGRLGLFLIELKKISVSPILGSGNFYMDCFPLMMIVQYGFVGATIIFSFLFKISKIVTSDFKPRINLNLAIYLLFWTSMINSMFEAQAPFGPGIKCFLVWLIFGFALAQNLKKPINYLNNIYLK